MKNLPKQRSDGDRLARYFQKKYGEIVYSGTLAIESALYSAGIKKGDYVVLPDSVCYRILLSVVRVQAKPIIITPQNGIILTVDDIKPILAKYKIKAVILVHNMGIPVDVKSFRELLPGDTVIIEDAAQAWRLKYSGFHIGGHSNYVITSFGMMKPLGLGIGGALFSNSSSFKKYLDFNNKASRENSEAILPYTFPQTTEIDIKKLVTKGDLSFRSSVRIANLLRKELDSLKIRIWNLQKGDVANWYKFPIFIDSKKTFDSALFLADKHHVLYELPHKSELSKIPMALKYNSLVIDNGTRTGRRVDLFTARNTLKNIKSWVKELKETLE